MRRVRFCTLGATNIPEKLPPQADALLDASIDCVKALSVDGQLLAMNPDGMCLMEIDDFATVKDQEWWALWPAEHRDTLKAAVARAGAGSVARFSADCPTAKGTPKHWDVVVSPVHNDAGETVSLLAISRDVTREVQIAGERALVVRELSHRISNLFAVVDGVIALSARTEPAAKSFAQSIRNRLRGLNRAISFIYGDKSAPAPAGGYAFHAVLEDLLAPYRGLSAESNFTIIGDDQTIGPTAVTPFALIFNELATNALKYGALAVPSGRVAISTRREGDAYTIVWSEHGAENVVAPERSGFGATLLDRTVTLQFRATLTREWRPDGLRLEMQIPLTSLRDA